MSRPLAVQLGDVQWGRQNRQAKLHCTQFWVSSPAWGVEVRLVFVIRHQGHGLKQGHKPINLPSAPKLVISWVATPYRMPRIPEEHTRNRTTALINAQRRLTTNSRNLVLGQVRPMSSPYGWSTSTCMIHPTTNQSLEQRQKRSINSRIVYINVPAWKSRVSESLN